MSASAVVLAHGVLTRLPQLVKDKRLSSGMTTRTAAADSGISATMINRIELGTANLNLAALLRVVAWLEPPDPVEPSPDMTPAAARLVATLVERDGLGRAWMRVEGSRRGLIVPDAAGTLGELAYVHSYTSRTIGEVINKWITLGTIESLPLYRGPRNRYGVDWGHPVELIRKDQR